MAEISASLVKQLREETGAGMMDCKQALNDADGDLEQARDWLRRKGLAQAAKKAGRAAAEGLVGVTTESTRGAMVEVNAETDFVARNETFQGFVGTVARMALDHNGDLEAMKQAAYPETDRPLDEELTQLIASIGENMELRRATALNVDNGVVVGYVHNQMGSGLGKIGVLVALESEGDTSKLTELGRNLAMHVAATQPQAVDVEGLDPDVVKRERAILEEQARESGKPEEIVQKMVDGRMKKFYQEAVLLEQTYVIDNETQVRQVVENAASDVGAAVQLKAFERFNLGEGKEAKEDDFASEVAAAAGQA